MAIQKAELEALLQASFPEAQIEVIDLVGDQDHYEARITTSQFSGLSRIQQHQKVYAALGDRVGGQIHALSLKTSAI